MPADQTVFFSSPEEWTRWLDEYAADQDEVWVGLWKQGTGHPSLSWDEAVDEGLCQGWIDGIRQSVDADRYRIRFTPRRSRSKWSAKNLKRFEELRQAGRVRSGGMAAFEARVAEPSEYSFERTEAATLPPEFQRQFEDDSVAYAFFEAQPPGYRRTSIHWVMAAKRQETRQRRLRTLIEDSRSGVRIKQLRRR